MPEKTDPPKDGVEYTYDRISPTFHKHRRDLWPPMDQFLNAASDGQVLLDLGCGAGRALRAGLERGYDVIGVDISSGQLKEASEYLQGAFPGSISLIKADMRSVPLQDGISDRTLMIASLHHLSDIGSRISALKEARRLTSRRGQLLVCVWSRDQDRFRERHLSRIEGRRTPDDEDGPMPGDFIVPWKDGIRAERFYHLYGPGELDREVNDAGWKILRSYFDGRNHWVEACLNG